MLTLCLSFKRNGFERNYNGSGVYVRFVNFCVWQKLVYKVITRIVGLCVAGWQERHGRSHSSCWNMVPHLNSMLTWRLCHLFKQFHLHQRNCNFFWIYQGENNVIPFLHKLVILTFNLWKVQERRITLLFPFDILICPVILVKRGIHFIQITFFW